MADNCIMRPSRMLSVLLCVSLVHLVDAFVPERHPGRFIRRTKNTVQQTASTSFLCARRPYRQEENEGGRQYDDLARQRITDRPTQTFTDMPGPPIIPSKPKIVVLGASGKIGRLVVRQLLESNIDATIVAFCRNYDKACDVLYDDMIVANRENKKRGPKLEIVQGDLVPPEELPGFVDQEEQQWLQRANSASAFYGTKVKEYDDREHEDSDPNEALQEAIKGCTTIISCVGSVRPSNVWTDFLVQPVWRLLHKDVSKWCKDPRHPFYVHYASTRKALGYAEREQMRREAAMAADETSGGGDDDNNINKESSKVPRIRFVRISDLCVTEQPWHLVPVVTNAMQSLVFRYQDMAERLLDASSLVETVVLRPGDLVDDERDANTTSLQVSPTGKVPLPSRVGREDVAALAIAAAMFDSQSHRDDIIEDETSDAPVILDQPLHYKLGVRWASAHLDPYPPQGTIKQGMRDATLCLQSALRTLRQDEKQQRNRRSAKAQTYPESVLRFAQSIPTRRRNLKPYGVCVAIPVYFVLIMMTKTLLSTLLPYIPGQQRWIRPALSQAGGLLSFIGAFLLNRLSLLSARLPAWTARLPAWLPQRAARQYISF